MEKNKDIVRSRIRGKEETKREFIIVKTVVIKSQVLRSRAKKKSKQIIRKEWNASRN